MNKGLQEFIGEIVQLELTGKKYIDGTVMDVGSDLTVVSQGSDYLYVPHLHVKSVRILNKEEIERDFVKQLGVPGIVLEENLSFRKVLTNAKGMFIELYVSGDEILHGYITSIMNNYFVFYSPIYKTMYITLNHVKWLLPYQNNQRPYGLDMKNFPVQPTSFPLARTFEVQVQKLKNELVVLNLGEENNPIGKVNGVVNNILELETARKQAIYLNLHHIKSIYKV